MKKIAFLFPGQGAQYFGMGKELYENFDEARNVFDKADASLPFKMTQLCFNEENEELNQTKYTQPAILTTSIATYMILKHYNINPSFFAGLSLGEYSALVASEMLDLETAVKLVFNRGSFMEEAVPKGKGSMAAIIGLDNSKVEEICKEASIKGIVEPANYNYNGQIVIGGETSSLDYACTLFEKNGAKRVVKLNVSGPFHTSLLKLASENLSEYLKKIQLNSWKIPIISNVTGKPYDDLSSVNNLLVKQVVSPVQWENSVKYMLNQGITHFIEVGPGKVLSGFVRRIDRKAKVLNVEDIKSLENTLKILGG